MPYNWQQKDWPRFTYQLTGVEDLLLEFAQQAGYVSGILKAMPENSQADAIINTLVAEAIKTSAIEGENLNRQDVISSVRNNLGLNLKHDKVKDKKAQGAGALIVAVRNTYTKPLTEKTLFEWHRTLMENSPHITTGAWRKHTEPMQVISGAMGKERVHFEAPPSNKVHAEMHRFITWFNNTAPGGKNEIKKAPVRSAIAHLYFESIHPFEDGNGRIGRAIAEKALSQTIGQPVLLSLSQVIDANKKAYYNALQLAQRSNEITAWINYFVNVVLQAQIQTAGFIEFTLKKARFFDLHKSHLNPRQLKAINKMLDAGPAGFKGGLTARKYISITKTSKATATRDLQQLSDARIITPEGSGRSVHYNLVL